MLDFLLEIMIVILWDTLERVNKKDDYSEYIVNFAPYGIHAFSSLVSEWATFFSYLCYHLSCCYGADKCVVIVWGPIGKFLDSNCPDISICPVRVKIYCFRLPSAMTRWIKWHNGTYMPVFYVWLHDRRWRPLCETEDGWRGGAAC